MAKRKFQLVKRKGDELERKTKDSGELAQKLQMLCKIELA